MKNFIFSVVLEFSVGAGIKRKANTKGLFFFRCRKVGIGMVRKIPWWVLLERTIPIYNETAFLSAASDVFGGFLVL